MRRKTESIATTPSAAAAENGPLATKLEKLLFSYADMMRPYDSVEALDFAAFMLYCSYISRNASGLELEDFDLDYSIDKVRDNLGNKYLASSFIDYYAGLRARTISLPDLQGIDLRIYDQSKAIASWVSALEASGLKLTEGCDGGTASAVRAVLTKVYASDYLGRHGGEFSTPEVIVDIVTRLASVTGKSVLDFACGKGVYLATALAKGAASACGRDINKQAVLRARIACFFADPTASHDIVFGNALSSDSVTRLAQRIFVAPPIAARLSEFDIREKEYYAEVMESVTGEAVARTTSMEDFCVAKAIASLATDGIGVMHVSAGFLFRQQRSRQALRHALVEQGYLQTVIELPGGVIPGTMVKSALLVIEKKATDDGVLIVDLDSRELANKGYVAKSRGRCEITEAGIDWLAKTVEERNEIPLVSTIADRKQILASGSNLCYSTYGDVFDYGSILEETRSTQDIMGDIRAAQASIDSLGEQIADILNSIEKKG